MGIAKSIETLIGVYNASVDKCLKGSDPLFRSEPDLYRKVFAANTGKLQELLNDEIEIRKEMV